MSRVKGLNCRLWFFSCESKFLSTFTRSPPPSVLLPPFLLASQLFMGVLHGIKRAIVSVSSAWEWLCDLEVYFEQLGVVFF